MTTTTSMSADDVLAVMQNDMKAASLQRSDANGLEAATQALHRSWAAHDAVAAPIEENKALREALHPFVPATFTPTGSIIGLMREDFERAQAALARVDGRRNG